MKRKKKKAIAPLEPLCVGYFGRSFFVIGKRWDGKTEYELALQTSANGTKFVKKPEKVLLKTSTGKTEDISKCRDFKIYIHAKGAVLTYVRTRGATTTLLYATGKSLKRLTVRGSVPITMPAILVPGAKPRDSQTLYYGKDSLRVASSKEGKRWHFSAESRRPEWRFFDGLPFELAGALSGAAGIYVVAGSRVTEDILVDVNRGRKVGEATILRAGVALFRADRPTELLWHTELPFMDLALEEAEASFRVLGLARFKKRGKATLRLYISVGSKIRFFEFPEVVLEQRAAYAPLLLARHPKNPIIAPSSEAWEHHATLNPTAVRLNDRVHILYRAIGADGVSRLGYASSLDGHTIAERLTYPTFIAPNPRAAASRQRYDPTIYYSGGSWGGSEDPRMVAIEDKVYVTFNLFSGWEHVRVAVVWLSLEDFLAKRFWKWSAPVLLSPSGQVHKNWILFPEKIKGKFALLHNLHGDDPGEVRVEYADSIENFVKEKDFKSADPNAIADRPIAWHKRMRSAGPPPIKTKEGWLLFYHATDRYEPHRYKLGVMLLDLNDPTKILARSRAAVLTPDMVYENDGKPGIVYACGAVEMGGVLHIYYGGADKVSCVATIKTADLLQHLLKGSDPRFITGQVTLH